MAKFIIQPHFRLQEWVAEELGFFNEEGLDYEFHEEVRASGRDPVDELRAARALREAP